MDTLRTDRLTLEPLRLGHADAMFEVLRDPALYRHLDSEPHPSIDHTRSVYARLVSRRSPDGRQGWLNWIVVPHGSGPVGFVQATILDGDRALLAYLLATAAQGRGYAAEAVTAMKRHLADRLHVHTFLATVEADHVASIALLGRVGMRPATPDESACHDLTQTERLFIDASAPGGSSSEAAASRRAETDADPYAMVDPRERLSSFSMKACPCRLATSDDIDAMARIRLLVRENALSDPARITRSMYEDHLGPVGVTWVCEGQQGVAGFASVTRDGEVWALFVAPEAEGGGVGSALLAQLVAWSIAQDLRALRLTTAVDSRADRFYREKGWLRGSPDGRGSVAYTLALSL